MLKKAMVFITALCMIVLFTGIVSAEPRDVVHSVTFGLDLNGDQNFSDDYYHYDYGDDYDVDPGVTIGYEGTVEQNNGIKLGGGFEYQLPRSMEGDGDFSFTSIYGVADIPVWRYHHDSDQYVILRLGYNTFSGDNAFKAGASLKGGLYCAVGYGMRVSDKMNIDFLVSQNNGSEEYEGNSIDVTYSKLSIVGKYNLQ